MAALRVSEVIQRARTLAARNRPNEALSQLTATLEEFPGDPNLRFEIGNQRAAAGALDEAVTVFRELLLEAPLSIAVLVNLAGTLMLQGKIENAIHHARGAVVIAPDNPTVVQTMADVEAVHSYTASVSQYRRLIAIAPSSATAHLNLAEALSRSSHWKEATDHFERAIELDPVTPLIRFDFAMHLLNQGRHREGWKHYEARLEPGMPDQPDRLLDLPQWQGESLSGKTLLVCTEQGLGDEIRFAAYLKQLSEIADTIIMETDPRMLSLYRRSFPKIRFNSFRRFPVRGRMRFTYDWLRDYPRPDYQVAIMSLPYLLGDRHERSVAPNGFLLPLEKRVEDLRGELEGLLSKRGPLVGLVWGSGMTNTRRARSYATIAHWKHVLSHPNATFFAMQYGDFQEDLIALRRLTERPIHILESLDLRDDLESVTAFASVMDCVVAMATATSVLSAAAGAVVIEIAAVNNFIPEIDGRDALIGTIRRPRAPKEGDWVYVFTEARRILDQIIE